MQRSRLSQLLLVLVIILSACSSQPTAAPTAVAAPAPEPTATWVYEETSPSGEVFNRQDMLTNIVDNIILPANADFVARTAALRTALQAFRDGPTVETLALAQDAWLTAVLAWKRAELFELGDAMELYSPVDKRPTNKARLEIDISDSFTIDAAYISTIGVTSRGLPVIEYLIFNPELALEDIVAQFVAGENAARRMAFLVAAAEDLHNQAVDVQSYWLPEGENYAETFGTLAGGSRLQASGSSLLMNRIVFQLENIYRMKISNPLAIGPTGTQSPQLAEAYLSGESLTLARKNLETIQTTFQGGEGIGLDDYLDFLGAQFEEQTLSSAIDDQFVVAFDAIDAIGEPLESAVLNNPGAVESALNEGIALLRLVKADMVTQMGVTLNYSDADND